MRNASENVPYLFILNKSENGTLEILINNVEDSVVFLGLKVLSSERLQGIFVVKPQLKVITFPH